MQYWRILCPIEPWMKGTHHTRQGNTTAWSATVCLDVAHLSDKKWPKTRQIDCALGVCFHSCCLFFSCTLATPADWIRHFLTVLFFSVSFWRLPHYGTLSCTPKKVPLKSTLHGGLIYPRRTPCAPLPAEPLLLQRTCASYFLPGTLYLVPRTSYYIH